MFFSLNAPLIYAQLQIFASLSNVQFFMTASSSTTPKVLFFLSLPYSVSSTNRCISVLSSRYLDHKKASAVIISVNGRTARLSFSLPTPIHTLFDSGSPSLRMPTPNLLCTVHDISCMLNKSTRFPIW